MPLTVTVLPVPTLAVSNVAVPLHVTTSVPITPVSAQVAVAAGVPSYTLFAALTVAVSVAAVMAAAVVAVDEASA